MPALRVLILAVLGFALTCGATVALGADRDIRAFYGKYVGKSVSDPKSGLSPRDLTVLIEPTEKGFVVEWTTVIPKPEGKVAHRSWSIEFRTTQRPRLYGSAMRKDMFGNRQPLDPMKGEPYVWAHIRGDTLSVYVLLVTAEGGYEMQAYHRTLTENGLDLRFTRQREDRTMKVVEGKLTRVDN